MYVGEESVAKNGMKMHIVTCHSGGRVSVKFDDGYIKEDIAYGAFKSGNVYNPNIQVSRSKRSERIGLEFVSKDGIRCRIIEYRSATDLDIEFDNGVVVRHKNYAYISKGIFSNPVVESEKADVGVISMAINGMRIKLIAYRTTDDIDVLFEDGYEVKTKYHFFKTGNIRHKDFGKTMSKYYYGYIDMKKHSVRDDGIVLFQYKDKEGRYQILPLREILLSVGKDLVF